MSNPQVIILMGSDSDLEIMRKAADTLQEYGVPYEMRVSSAHRNPKGTCELAEQAEANGVKAFICGAGVAAHLAGVVAAHTCLPVIGVPLASGPLNGADSLHSTVQMPSGIPVATVAINGAKNAALLAIQMLALSNTDLREKLHQLKERLREENIAKNKAL